MVQTVHPTLRPAESLDGSDCPPYTLARGEPGCFRLPTLLSDYSDPQRAWMVQTAHPTLRPGRAWMVQTVHPTLRPGDSLDGSDCPPTLRPG